MEVWRGISHFVLSIRFREMVRMENLKAVSLSPVSGPFATNGRIHHSQDACPAPEWLHGFVDSEMSFDQVRYVIGMLRGQMSEEIERGRFPDIEFLPVFQ